MTQAVTICLSPTFRVSQEETSLEQIINRSDKSSRELDNDSWITRTEKLIMENVQRLVYQNKILVLLNEFSYLTSEDIISLKYQLLYYVWKVADI